MPTPDPNGRLAALLTAAGGQQASPGSNPIPPQAAPGQEAGGPSPLGPNVEPELPGPLEERAQQQATSEQVTTLLARVSALENVLVARGVVQAQDLNPGAPPAPDQGALPGLEGGVPPGGPPGGGQEIPAQLGGPGAAPQPMGAGPKQPY